MTSRRHDAIASQSSNANRVRRVAVPHPAPASSRATEGLRRAGVSGLAGYLPGQAVSSDVIAKRLGVPVGWIEKRTGIHSRRQVNPEARVADLARIAGKLALADANLDASAVDLVLVATLQADEVTPNAAPQVAHGLGATAAGAIDIGSACVGFVSGLTLAASMIETGRASSALVIGAEILSRHVDHHDRSTAGLFGDGAGAVLLTACEAGGVGRAVLGADGSASSFIVAPRTDGLIRMDGHEIFKRAVSTFVSNAADAVAANGLALADIDLFVFHQANGRILDAVRDALGVGPESVLNVIADTGNTSAASIPLALCAARDQGLLRDGSRVLLGAVGAGYTWGSLVVEWASSARPSDERYS